MALAGALGTVRKLTHRAEIHGAVLAVAARDPGYNSAEEGGLEDSG